MHDGPCRVGEETGAKKTFVWALDWPGWCRGGKDAALAIDALIEHGPRYALVAREAGLELPDVSPHDLVHGRRGARRERHRLRRPVRDHRRRPPAGLGGGGGAPGARSSRRRGRCSSGWSRPRRSSCARDRAAAAGTATRSSRTSTRPTTPTPGHGDQGRGARSRPTRPRSTTMRQAMLDAIGVPSDGSPIAGRKWPPRYAARRIAWHALDHAWEIEDRTEP